MFPLSSVVPMSPALLVARPVCNLLLLGPHFVSYPKAPRDWQRTVPVDAVRVGDGELGMAELKVLSNMPNIEG